MNRNESKYFNTAKRMDEALILLLEKKDFEYVTIKEICNAAEVNRSTFYLHYENTTDLLKETTQYILDNFQSYFSVDTINISRGFNECELKELLFITPEYITPYLTFIKENQRVFRTALKHFGTMDFGGVYKKMYLHIFDPILTRFNFPPEQRRFVMKFYLSGVTAVAMEWLNDGCKEDINTIVKVIEECVMGDRIIRE